MLLTLRPINLQLKPSWIVDYQIQIVHFANLYKYCMNHENLITEDNIVSKDDLLNHYVYPLLSAE